MSNRTGLFLSPQMLLQAYANGIFPMAESAQSHQLNWYDPPVRALIPLDENFHVPRSLARKIRKQPFKITLNKTFQEVMCACAAPYEGRETTWINNTILNLYTALHRNNHAHSIEVWNNTELVGGLYGVSLGTAFFGESMFSRKTDASKIALVHLVALLKHHGYTILDTQFLTSHLQRFGTFEIARSAYHLILQGAIQRRAIPFPAQPDWSHLVEGVLSPQPVTQIS